MREKIAESGELTITTPEMDPQAVALIEEPAPTSSPDVLSSPVLQECQGHQPFTGYWSADGVMFEVVEGARLVYREMMVEQDPALTIATSTPPVAPQPQKQIILQLPDLSVPASIPSCVSSDVVGVAKDGSLIRNNEASLYGVFGPETLVGYALDGFPIYGTAAIQTDVCGGAVIGGQYRYQISADRPVILNCFAGTPASL